MLEDKTLWASRQALTGLNARQTTIADNIANADTPGFNGKEVQFESALQSAIARGGRAPGGSGALKMTATSAGHIALKTPSGGDSVSRTVSTAGSMPARFDGNNVDIDREMSLLAETQLTYNAIVQTTASKLAGLRTAINEGRR